MHFCFSCKLLGNIDSYVAEHNNNDECSDISYNQFAADEFASWKTTPTELRINVEKYFINNGLKLIESN